MISIARTLGAPVIEPQGKAARSTSTAPLSAGRVAVTSDTSWWIVGKLSTRNRSGTATDPGTATRDRSLRIRSTIIRFSARCLGSAASVRAAAASASASASRAAVPFIGRAIASRPRSAKKSSGDSDAIAWLPVQMKPP